jgi:hypothetical protein
MRHPTSPAPPPGAKTKSKTKTKEKQDRKKVILASHPAIEEEAGRCCLCYFFFPVRAGQRAFGLV